MQTKAIGLLVSKLHLKHTHTLMDTHTHTHTLMDKRTDTHMDTLTDTSPEKSPKNVQV